MFWRFSACHGQSTGTDFVSLLHPNAIESLLVRCAIDAQVALRVLGPRGLFGAFAANEPPILKTLQTTGICEKPAGAAPSPDDDLVYDNPVDEY